MVAKLEAGRFPPRGADGDHPVAVPEGPCGPRFGVQRALFRGEDVPTSQDRT